VLFSFFLLLHSHVAFAQAASSMDSGMAKDEVWRSFHRLLVGDATYLSNANDASATWMPDSTMGADWLIKNSTLAVMSPAIKNRQIAITGFSNTSQSNSTSAGVAGAAYCNNEIVACRGFYGDVQFENGLYGYGLELAIKNKSGKEIPSTPYGTQKGGTFGIQLSGTGDPAYGGTANASTSAGIIFIGQQPHAFHRGIVFGSDALTGTTGDDTGTAVAISMAMGQLIQWENEKKQAATLGIAKGAEDGSVDIIATPAGASGKLKTPRLNISDIPTSPEGLVSGDIWRQGDTLKIVP